MKDFEVSAVVRLLVKEDLAVVLMVLLEKTSRLSNRSVGLLQLTTAKKPLMLMPCQGLHLATGQEAVSVTLFPPVVPRDSCANLLSSGKRLAMQELRIMITLLVLSFEFEPVPQNLNSMRGIELMFRKPEQCYVRLKTL